MRNQLELLISYNICDKNNNINIQMGRLWIFAIFTILCLFAIHRQKFVHKITKHYPAESPVLNDFSDPSNFYLTGKYNISLMPVPKVSLSNPLGFLHILSRKKVNGFMFSQYNLYKLEINFVDLGYGSLVQINYWAQDVGSLKMQQKIGISLQQDFSKTNLNLDIHKQNFHLVVRQSSRMGHSGHSQTVTNFNITLQQNSTSLSSNYTHIRRDQQCFTAVRNNVISHKCYGGYGYGKVKVQYVVFDQEQQKYKRKMSAYNPRANQTRCSFDGFRGTGFHWQWTWAYAAGFSKPEFYSKNQTIQKQRWIGFNFGSLYNKSEDFLFLNGKIYPIQGVKYEINQKFQKGKNITFTAQNPKINMNFLVMDRTALREDMGVLKNQMIKAEGHWAGYIMDPENPTNQIDFYEMSGLIESVDSVF